MRADPRYRATHVYGNVLIEHPNSGNNDIVHYGGDGGGANKFRKGTLYFYNNTVVSDRTDATRLFRMATNDESMRRPQQHRLRDRRGRQPAGARQLRPADPDPELVQDGLDAVHGQPSQGHDHQQRHR